MTPALHFRLWWLTLLGMVGLTLTAQFLFWFLKLGSLNVPIPNCGDIARIAQSPEISECRLENRSLPKLAMPLSALDEAYYATLGDSFSRGRGGGENNYWQDYLATHSGHNVAWLSELTDDFILDAYEYGRSGLLTELGIRYFVLQVSESNLLRGLGQKKHNVNEIPIPREPQTLRDFNAAREGAFQPPPPRLAEGVVWTHTRALPVSQQWRAAVTQFVYSLASAPLWKIDRWYSEHITDQKFPIFEGFLRFVKQTPGLPSLDTLGLKTFSANGERNPLPSVFAQNFKWLQGRLGRHYLLRSDRYTYDVQVSDMKSKRFESSDKLYWLLRDWKVNRDLSDDQRLVVVNENLNNLADYLQTISIELIFMPTPSKLTAYQDTLETPVLDPSTVFARLRVMRKNYIYVDAPLIVGRAIDDGEVDVYYHDDSHWTNRVLARISKEFPLK